MALAIRYSKSENPHDSQKEEEHLHKFVRLCLRVRDELVVGPTLNNDTTSKECDVVELAQEMDTISDHNASLCCKDTLWANHMV